MTYNYYFFFFAELTRVQLEAVQQVEVRKDNQIIYTIDPFRADVIVASRR